MDCLDWTALPLPCLALPCLVPRRPAPGLSDSASVSPDCWSSLTEHTRTYYLAHSTKHCSFVVLLYWHTRRRQHRQPLCTAAPDRCLFLFRKKERPATTPCRPSLKTFSKTLRHQTPKALPQDFHRPTDHQRIPIHLYLYHSPPFRLLLLLSSSPSPSQSPLVCPVPITLKRVSTNYIRHSSQPDPLPRAFVPISMILCVASPENRPTTATSDRFSRSTRTGTGSLTHKRSSLFSSHSPKITYHRPPPLSRPHKAHQLKTQLCRPWTGRLSLSQAQSHLISNRSDTATDNPNSNPHPRPGSRTSRLPPGPGPLSLPKPFSAPTIRFSLFVDSSNKESIQICPTWLHALILGGLSFPPTHRPFTGSKTGTAASTVATFQGRAFPQHHTNAPI